MIIVPANSCYLKYRFQHASKKKSFFSQMSDESLIQQFNNIFMKTNRVTMLCILFISAIVYKTTAQDTQTDNHQITVVIPSVALLDLETSVSKNFSASFTQAAPAEAGDKLTIPVANADLWLNYSSILAATGLGSISRRVDVKASALVPGVTISVVAGAITTGFGSKGTPTSAVTLTTADQPIISTIGSAYTVTGPSNGHKLTYSFAALDANYAALKAGSTVITVTYTLADN